MFSNFFNKEFVEKAKGYSKFFDSWTDITEKNGIASAASYSRIKDFEKGIVIIELDHPGWKQILQTKQSKLLYDFQYRFPDMDITGISLMLAANPPNNQVKPSDKDEPSICSKDKPYIPPEGLETIKDEAFRETLLRIGQLIQKRENV